MNSTKRHPVWVLLCVGLLGFFAADMFRGERILAQPPEGAGNQNLLNRIIELETKLASVSVVGDDVIFEGVNVVVRNGGGATDTINGTGNLIVGYDEVGDGPKSGSHNLVVGSKHTYTSFGGFVAGIQNTISGENSSVSGGGSNTASGAGSSVSGGGFSEASARLSTVSGGASNAASGDFSTVSGGQSNRAKGGSSTVSGGFSNLASGPFSTVSGGRQNEAIGNDSTVSGGRLNLASGQSSTVSGGGGNTAAAQDSHVP